MNVTGIIAEYNPFHLGHQYHMEQARRITGADYIIVVMSGDFVQRGAPAVFDKYSRTRMALLAGADLVLEIPSAFASGSAQDFASCSVALLGRLGVTDSLFFGSECGDISLLLRAAEILTEEPEEYSSQLKNFLRMGHSFPSASERALEAYLCGGQQDTCRDESQNTGLLPLSSPNDILGIEYCKAIRKQNLSLRPVTLKRLGDYHASSLESEEDTARYSSASAIREELFSGGLSRALNHVPECLHDIFKSCSPIFPDDFSSLLNYAILDAGSSPDAFSRIDGFSAELSKRLAKFALNGGTWEERIMQLKTKNYTYARISRALLHLLLHIDQDYSSSLREYGYAPYGRILGFRKSSAPLLSSLKQNTSIPLVTKPADARDILGDELWPFLEKDFYASHIYQSVLSAKYRLPFQNEYTRTPVILP